MRYNPAIMVDGTFCTGAFLVQWLIGVAINLQHLNGPTTADCEAYLEASNMPLPSPHTAIEARHGSTR